MDISQRNLLELAMSSLPTGLFICDRDGIIRFINDAYANYLRVRPEDAMGRHITDFIPDSGIPAVIASGEPELGAWRSIQGSERKILVNRIPLRDQDGHVIGAFSLTLFDTPEQMQALLQRVDFLDKKVNSYARRIKSALRASHTINSILGNSPAITAFKSYLLRYARTESPVLILGATGTGKELAASAIHMASNRPDGPFVSINCAAIPKELFESEVFGYVPGAFSGAHQGRQNRADRTGRSGYPIPRRSGGSSPARAGQAAPGAGGENPLPARIVAAPGRGFPACRRDQPRPQKMIAAGTFREDLYYRINPMTLNLPPLSERVEDIPLIVRDVLNRMGGEGVRCTESAMNALMRYPWPGNIRELRNVLIRALSLCQDNQITLTDLPSELRQQAVAESAGTDGKLQSVVKNSEAQTIILALGDHHWNVAKTARALGISRASMYEKMRKFSIKRPPNGF